MTVKIEAPQPLDIIFTRYINREMKELLFLVIKCTHKYCTTAHPYCTSL